MPNKRTCNYKVAVIAVPLLSCDQNLFDSVPWTCSHKSNTTPPSHVSHPSICVILASCTLQLLTPYLTRMVFHKATVGSPRFSSQGHTQWFPCKTWRRWPCVASSCIMKCQGRHISSAMGARRLKVSCSDKRWVARDCECKMAGVAEVPRALCHTAGLAVTSRGYGITL